jgi:hypothetical protein
MIVARYEVPGYSRQSPSGTKIEIGCLSVLILALMGSAPPWTEPLCGKSDKLLGTS